MGFALLCLAGRTCPSASRARCLSGADPPHVPRGLSLTLEKQVFPCLSFPRHTKGEEAPILHTCASV